MTPLRAEWLLIVACVLLLLLILLLCAYWYFQHRKKKDPLEQEAKDKAGEEAKRREAERLPRAFTQALSTLKDHVAGPEYRYKVPWYIMLGAQGSGKTSLLTKSSLSVSLQEDGQSFPGQTPVGWKYYGDGLVLDPGGEWTLSPNGNSSAYWKRLLSLLNQYRPERPLEGIVVTIAVTDFLGAAPLDAVALVRRASQLQERLQQAQAMLGFSFPLYVVLTKCDLIPGFRDFARELDPSQLSQMFGWSSPYSTEALFEDGWVEEGFRQMAETVERKQDELFLVRGHSRERQGMFVLPDYLRALSSPMASFLGKVLRPLSEDSCLPLRGIYLAGECETLDLPSQLQNPGQFLESSLPSLHYDGALTPQQREIKHRAAVGEVVFVYELFFKKIFAEGDLAQPVRKFLHTRNRAEAFLQFATVASLFVFLIGTIVANYRLRRNARDLDPILTQIAYDLKPASDGYSRYNSTEDFLVRIASFQASGLRYVFIPSSWTGYLDKKVRSALTPAFRMLVLEHFHDALEEKSRKITTGEWNPVGALGTQTDEEKINITDVSALREYIQLRSYVNQLQLLEKNIALYQSIAVAGGSANADAVFSVEEYLYDRNQKMPIQDARNPYFVEALAKAHFRPFSIPEKDRENATSRMTSLTEALFTAWIQENPTKRALRDLGAKLDEAEKDPGISYDQLQHLRGAFYRAESNMNKPTLQWVAKDTFEMPPELYTVAIVPLQHSAYLNSELTNWVTFNAEQKFNKLQDDLAEVNSGVTGPLVEFTEDSKLEFSENADKAKTFLNSLLALPFMASSFDKTLPESVPQGVRVVWSAPLLQNLLQQPQASQTFAADLQDAPVKLKNFFQRLARERMRKALETQIVLAQSFAPRSIGGNFQRDVQPEIQNFAVVSDTLAAILTMLQQQALTDLRARLENYVNVQALQLLESVDLSFRRQRLYELPEPLFDQWVGNEAPTSAVLDARSPEDVQAYLANQREEIQSYSQSIAPLLRFFSQQKDYHLSTNASALLDKWRGIHLAMEQYEKKMPGNSVAAFESFIATDMDKIAPGQLCPQVPVKAVFLQDYFVRARMAIRGEVYRRCKAIASFNLARDYRDLSGNFNSALAGRFPFTPPDLASRLPGADPEAIRTFYQKYEAKGPLLRSAVEQLDGGSGSYSEVMRFLEEVGHLRSIFLATGMSEGSLPALDFQPQFRVNRSKEVDGDQILSWTLSVGSDVFRSGDAPRLLHWSYGQPVILTLQWAKDAPSLPLKGSVSGNGVVSGNTIQFRFNDAWAFFSMLMRQATPPAQVELSKDSDPFILRFQVYESAPGPYRRSEGSSGPAVATVFLQLKVFPPGEKQPIRQLVFPTEAASLPVTGNAGVKAGGQ